LTQQLASHKEAIGRALEEGSSIQRMREQDLKELLQLKADFLVSDKENKELSMNL
jgi:hypothetical protein